MDEVGFLPADKHWSFLQVYTLFLGLHSQACPKYPKLQVCNIIAISQGKSEDEVDFYSADKIKVFFQIDDIILGVCVASHAQITQNCNFAFFCNIFRKKWLMNLIFCIQISIKTSYKLILWFLMGMIKHFQSSQVSKIASSQNSKFAISSQYISKKVVRKLIFCMQINIKISYKLILTL